MSLGWFTLGATGDIKVTNINVNEGIFYVDKVSKRLGINVRESPDPLILGTDPLPPFQPLSQLQIGKPDITTTVQNKFQINTQPLVTPRIPTTYFAEQANIRSMTNTLIFADESYRPTSGNITGATDTAGFTKTFDSTMWIASKGSRVKNYGTGISFGGLGKNGKYVPYTRISGVAGDQENQGEFVVEVLKEISPTDVPEDTTLHGQPMLYERLRIKSNGRIGLGVYEPEYDFEMAGGFKSSGIVNFGYDIRGPTVYDVSGATILDYNSVNVYSSTRQSEAWYYNLENTGNINFYDDNVGTFIVERRLFWAPNKYPDQYTSTNTSFDLKVYPDVTNVVNLAAKPDGYRFTQAGVYRFYGIVTNDSNIFNSFFLDIIDVSGNFQSQLLNIYDGVPPWSTRAVSGTFTLTTVPVIIAPRVGDILNTYYQYGTRLDLNITFPTSIDIIKPSVINSVTSDSLGDVYTAGFIDIYNDGGYDARLFEEETTIRSPNFEQSSVTARFQASPDFQLLPVSKVGFLEGPGPYDIRPMTTGSVFYKLRGKAAVLEPIKIITYKPVSGSLEFGRTVEVTAVNTLQYDNTDDGVPLSIFPYQSNLNPGDTLTLSDGSSQLNVTIINLDANTLTVSPFLNPSFLGQQLVIVAKNSNSTIITLTQNVDYENTRFNNDIRLRIFTDGLSNTSATTNVKIYLRSSDTDSYFYSPTPYLNTNYYVASNNSGTVEVTNHTTVYNTPIPAIATDIDLGGVINIPNNGAIALFKSEVSGIDDLVLTLYGAQTKISVISKIKRNGDIQWVSKIDGASNEFGVTVATALNRTSGTSDSRFDVYVAGVSNSSSITAYSTVAGSSSSWSTTNNLTRSFANNGSYYKVFVVRYEPVLVNNVEIRMDPKEICTFEHPSKDVYLLGMDAYYPKTSPPSSTDLRNNTEISISTTIFEGIPSFYNYNGVVNALNGKTLVINGYVVSLMHVNSNSTSNYLNIVKSNYQHFSSGLSDIANFGFLPSGTTSLNNSDTYRGKEGCVRRDYLGNIYLAFPSGINGSVSTPRYHTYGISFTVEPGSLIYHEPYNGSVANTKLINLKQSTKLIITSIDVDNGRDGVGTSPSIYVAGHYTGTISVNSYTSRTSSSSAAFLLKFGYNPDSTLGYALDNICWLTVIDGTGDEYGVSVAVDRDLNSGQNGRYNVHIGGAFNSSRITVYNADPALNLLRTLDNSGRSIELSEIGVQGHREAFVVKFNYRGSFMFNYKAGGNGDVSPLCIDVGVGDNLCMVGSMTTDFARFTEPDGTVSRYFRKRISQKGIRYPAGFIFKYRTSDTVILNSDRESKNYKKTILNQTGLPLYVCLFKEVNNIASGLLTDLATITANSSMTFINYGNQWYPDTSNKLSSDILSVDKDNAQIGIGTRFPDYTLDVRGDQGVSGALNVGRDISTGGRINVSDIRNSVHTSADYPYKINGQPIFSKGMIMMWSGSPTDVPIGWVLCEGGALSDGTSIPDLRGRFVIGQKQDPTANNFNNHPIFSGDTSGSVQFQMNQKGGYYYVKSSLPEHRHGYVTPAVTLTTDKNGWVPGGSASTKYGVATASVETTATGEDDKDPNVPPFYVLAFIMKT